MSNFLGGVQLLWLNILGNIDWLVVEPTHLEKIFIRQFGYLPQIRGENKKQFETTTQTTYWNQPPWTNEVAQIVMAAQIGVKIKNMNETTT